MHVCTALLALLLYFPTRSAYQAQKYAAVGTTAAKMDRHSAGPTSIAIRMVLLWHHGQYRHKGTDSESV